MTQFRAAGIGEILWDILPDGKKLGGAPANFAYHFKALGGESLTVSRLGDDALGREALALLQENHLATEGITFDPVHPTGRVDVEVDTRGIATYTFPEAVAWDFIEINAYTKTVLPTLDAVCFGTLAQRSAASRAAILSLLRSLPESTLKIYDINLRQDFYTTEIIDRSLHLADVLKINDDELDIVASLLGLAGDQETVLSTLLREFSLCLGVLTRGERGSLLMTPDAISESQGMSVNVVDTIGAGDSFTAAMTLAWLNEEPLDAINQYASEVAAAVCTRAGAMPPIPDRFKKN